MAKSDSPVKPEDVKAVGARCETAYHAITALHDLCGDGLSSPENSENCARTFVLMRETLRSLARDMENCAEILQNDRGGLGFFEAHYGSV